MNGESELAHALGVSRSSLYYVSRKGKTDWLLKAKIEESLRAHPAYGSRRLAIHLSLNRKRLQRVMRRCGIRHTRIHSALKMPPTEFAKAHRATLAERPQGV